MTKRNNESLGIDLGLGGELTKDVWMCVFWFIADQRLLPLRAVSRDWNQWIVEEGLTELTDANHFLKKIKNFGQYKSLRSIHINNRNLTKELVFKRGSENFSRLVNVSIIENVSQAQDFYIKILKYMPNLVSLRLHLTNQDVPPEILPSLQNLRVLSINISKDRNYSYLSQMTQTETLCIIYSDKFIPDQNTLLLLDQSLSQLTQLKSLQLIRPLAPLGFIEKLHSLERLLIETDDLTVPLKLPDLSKCINLRRLKLPVCSDNLSLVSLQSLKHLECFCCPGIPSTNATDLLASNLPSLKHLVVNATYANCMSNTKRMTYFLQNYPKGLNIGISLAVQANDRHAAGVYLHLLEVIMSQNKCEFISSCPHCSDSVDRVFYYLNEELQRLFTSQ